MIVLNFGGGVNSTALLVEAHRRGLRPDVIVFSDTGSEMPHTYTHLAEMQDWLNARSWPAIDVVRWIRKRDSQTKRKPDGTFTVLRSAKKGDFVTIEQQCLEGKELPSKAYGLSGCTVKWKQQPIDEFLAAHARVVVEHAAGRTVERWIGYDADEPQRAARMVEKNPRPDLWTWRSPLVEWDMGRDECIEAIGVHGAGLKAPRKSACFFCPSSTKKDVLHLRDTYPDLFARALAIEDGAAPNLRTRKGLGQSAFAWRTFVEETDAREAAKKKGLPVVADTTPDLTADIACGCYDGEA